MANDNVVKFPSGRPEQPPNSGRTIGVEALGPLVVVVPDVEVRDLGSLVVVPDVKVRSDDPAFPELLDP